MTENDFIKNQKDPTALQQYVGSEECVVIPDSFKKIMVRAFKDCTHVKSVIIPDSIEVIAASAFQGCIELTEITIPDSVKQIGKSAFKGCKNLADVALGAGITMIEKNTFSDCEALQNIYIPSDSKLHTIGVDAFKNCSKLKEFISPITLKYIYRAFTDCSCLERVELSAGILSYDFSNCEALKSIIIPEGVTKIMGLTGTSIRDIVIPNTVTEIGHGALGGCIYLSEITLPLSVNIIRDMAFSCCKSLTKINIPDTVTRIEYETFSGCTSLSKITLPDQIEIICDGAFRGCSSLSKINIPESVNYIGKHAFYNCVSLTEITIPESVEKIGDEAFAQCSSLKNVTLTIDKPEIKDCVFSDSPFYDDFLVQLKNEAERKHPGFIITDGYLKKYTGNEEDISIPDDIECISCDSSYENGEEVSFKSPFENCESIKTIRIPASVSRIDDYSFENCVNLRTVIIDPDNETYTSGEHSNAIIKKSNNELIFLCRDSEIPDTVKRIGTHPFSAWSDVKKITIPSSVTHICEYAFSNCTSIESINVDKGNKQYDSRNNCNAIITSEGEYSELLLGCKNTTIPNTVGSIGSYAFKNCTGLKELHIPASVYLVSNCFTDCVNLESITVDSDNETYDSRNDCNAIIKTNKDELILGCKNTVIPPDVKVLGTRAFSHCRDMKEIIIPNGVTKISDSFYHCSALERVEIPNSVEWLDTSAFCQCTGLTCISIPDSVKWIGSWAFSGCCNLKEIILGKGVKTIDSYAFTCCSALEKTVIPKDIEKIRNNAFKDCTNLKEIIIPDKYIDIENYAFENTAYSNDESNWVNGILYISNMLVKAKEEVSGCVNVREGTIAILPSAFEGNELITKVVLPESVVSIGEKAFMGCTELEEINIPKGLKYLHDYSLSHCKKIKSLVFPEEVPCFADRAIIGCSKLKELVLPKRIGETWNASFGNYDLLTELIIPDGVRNLNDSSIGGKKLKKVFVPDSVTSIKKYAFDGCSKRVIVVASKDSYAKTFAKRNGYKFEAIEK